MKKFLISIILLVSCENSLIEEIKETHTNGNPKLIHYKKSIGDTLVLFKIMNYHENGNIKEEESYKDNKLEGKQISYYDNGNIYSERNYKNGKKEGQWIYYNKNGIIKKDDLYEEDKLIEEKIKPNAKYCSDCGRYH